MALSYHYLSGPKTKTLKNSVKGERNRVNTLIDTCNTLKRRSLLPMATRGQSKSTILNCLHWASETRTNTTTCKQMCVYYMATQRTVNYVTVQQRASRQSGPLLYSFCNLLFLHGAVWRTFGVSVSSSANNVLATWHGSTIETAVVR